jgi:predicted polyphosphate/ATP-dependent NAD kinase
MRFGTRMRIGFVVNPVAGMGGTVGLKGTDGEDILKEAVARGATRQSPLRTSRALRGLKGRTDAEFMTCSGEMGKEELDRAGIRSVVVHEPPAETSRKDTVAAVRAFVRDGADIVIFAGGDGTARDVLEAADRKVPVIGIPTGVKMHSAVFVNSPEDLPLLLEDFSRTGATRDAEVMDIDEVSFRKGVLKAKVFGLAKVPEDRVHLQAGKAEYHSGGADEEAREIGQYVVDEMEDGVAYIVGPGSTTAIIGEVLGQAKALLGVDVFLNRKLVLHDASEQDLLGFLRHHGASKIIATPIGAQGFFFGRGNQQISARVIKAVGGKNVVVLATPTKLKDTPVLRVDTGDSELDESLRGRIRVVTGYRRRRLLPVL